MTDRSLLELAAKAVGIAVEGYGPNGVAQGKNGPCLIKWWNPLTDDGDALRLAATLRLVIKPGKHKGDGCTVESQRDGVADCTSFRECPQERMRYAIVFVAAEIGKGMK